MSGSHPHHSKPYRSHPLLRVRAFFLTDRIGHTIASTIGMTKVIWWWARGRVRRVTGRGPAGGT